MYVFWIFYAFLCIVKQNAYSMISHRLLFFCQIIFSVYFNQVSVFLFSHFNLVRSLKAIIEESPLQMSLLATTAWQKHTNHKQYYTELNNDEWFFTAEFNEQLLILLFYRLLI